MGARDRGGGALGGCEQQQVVLVAALELAGGEVAVGEEADGQGGEEDSGLGRRERSRR